MLTKIKSIERMENFADRNLTIITLTAISTWKIFTL